MTKPVVRVDLRFPNISVRLDDEMIKIANRDIIPDIQTRMAGGIDLEGRPHKENTPQTRINKSIRGYKTTPLIASGQLRKSFKAAVIGPSMVAIFPKGTRKPYRSIKKKYRIKNRKAGVQSNQIKDNLRLAKILQIEGIKTGHKYQFFGISDRAEARAMRRMTKFVDEAIRRGQFRVKKTFNG